MSKRMPIVAIASLLAGTAMAGVVVHMQRNPMAFTSAASEQWTPSAPTRRAAPVYFDEATDEGVEQPATAVAFQPKATVPKAVAAPPMRKLARRPAPEALYEPAAQPAEVEAAPAPEPCAVSAWRTVGLKENGAPRHVRAICP